MYVARDEDGEVYLYDIKPHKNMRIRAWSTNGGGYVTRIDENKLPKSINPSWDDTEPIEVKLVRKNK